MNSPEAVPITLTPFSVSWAQAAGEYTRMTHTLTFCEHEKKAKYTHTLKIINLFIPLKYFAISRTAPIRRYFGLGRGWDMGTLRFVDIIDLSAYSKPKYAFFVHFHAKWTKQGK